MKKKGRNVAASVEARLLQLSRNSKRSLRRVTGQMAGRGVMDEPDVCDCTNVGRKQARATESRA